MSWLPGALALVALGSLSIGCGSADEQPTLLSGSGGAGGASGGTSAGQSGAAGTAPRLGVSGSAGQNAASSGAGGAVACSTYLDETGYTLPVHIKNSSSVTLYLGPKDSTCEAAQLFQIEDGARHPLLSLDGCHTSCQALMQTGPVACPLACAGPATVTLAPGQTIDVPWDGRFGVPQSLPQQCMPAASTSPTSCVQAQKVEPAAFTFIAQAGTQHTCLAASGACNCVPNANGTCTSPSSVITGTIITTELFLKLEPGETSPGGAPQYIALEFKNTSN